jgi:DNA repair photolyase
MHAAIKCHFQCQYCFSKWKKYQNHNIVNNYIGDNLFICPFCDSELEFQDYDATLLSIVEQAKLYKVRIIISISTKSYLKDTILTKLQLAHEKLSEYGGFVKISVTITNKNFPDIEPRTASYYERIRLLEKLMTYKMKTSVVIKPILPFVPSDEYIEILNEVCDFTDRFLIGGLYVDESTIFYKNYIQGKYETVTREVNWHNGEKWSYIDSTTTQNAIKNYLVNRGKKVFDSDQDLIESWL